MFGNPNNYNTEGGEQNHKFLIKKPARTARKYAPFFSDQVAKRVSENLILKCIQQQSQSPMSQIKGYQANNHKTNLKGSRFKISYQMPHQPHVQFLSGKLNFHFYQEHMPGLFDYLLEHFVPDEHSKVICYTEYKDENILLRAHPNYYGGGPWFDWVKVQRKRVQNEETIYKCFPARLVCFLEWNGQSHCVIQCCGDNDEQFGVLATLWSTERKDDNTPLYRNAPIGVVRDMCFVMMESEESAIEIQHYKLWPDNFL